MSASVSGASPAEGACANAPSERETSSPGGSRNFPPADSSPASSSLNAAESQLSAGFPDRFTGLRTATPGRMMGVEGADRRSNARDTNARQDRAASPAKTLQRRFAGTDG